MSSREYRLLNRVMETDFAETFRAVAGGGSEPPRPAYLHLLTPRAATAEVVGRLRQHAAALGAIRFPNLIVPWEAGLAGERWAVAVPASAGHHLDLVLSRCRSRELSVPLHQAVHLLAETANGLSALHQGGLFHGGLGPEDIVLCNNGSIQLHCSGIRLILDSVRATRHLAQRGRKRYRAPEQARGGRPTPSADVFALGAVGFELITRQNFDGPPRPGGALRTDFAQLPSRLDRRIPAKFDSVLLRAVELTPQRRYDDAAAFRDALWEHLDGMGQVVTPAELAELAASVLPNEVVVQSFDPDEVPSGMLPIEGVFSIDPDAPLPQSSQPVTGEAPGRGVAPAADAISTRERTVKIALPPDEPADDAKTDGGDDPGEQVESPAAAADLFEAERKQRRLAGASEEPGAGEASVRGFVAVAAPSRQAAQPPEGEGPGSVAPPEADQIQDEDTDPGRREVAAAAAAPEAAREAGVEAGAGIRQAWSAAGTARTARPRSSPGASLLNFLSIPVPLFVLLGVAIVFGSLGFSCGRLTAPGPVTPTPLMGAQVESLGASTIDPRPSAQRVDEEAKATDANAGEPEDSAAAEAESRASSSPPAEVEVVASEKVAAARPATTRRRAPAGQGRLTIDADMRAQVLIDGRNTGRHTPLQGYLVQAGRRRITLVGPQGLRHTETVIVRPDQVTVLQVEMR